MKKVLFVVSLLLIGTSAVAKPTAAQIKKAVSNNFSNMFSGYYGRSCPMGLNTQLNDVKVIQEGKYNKKRGYYPYKIKINISCKRGSNSIPGQKERNKERTAIIKLFKDDFGEYQAVRSDY